MTASTSSTMPPPAAQASLRADAQYISMLAAQSAWPMQYAMSRPAPVAARSHVVQGLPTIGVASDAVGAYNSLLPANYRMAKRASQNRLQTELVGTSPYMALGRGIANHVDTNTALLQGTREGRDASRATAGERTWDRRDFVAVPSDLRLLPQDELRFGAMTRVGPAYAQPHDS